MRTRRLPVKRPTLAVLAALTALAALAGCQAPEERPAPAPVRAVDDARPAPVRGGRMRLDDSLALCLCDYDRSRPCYEYQETCWSPQDPATPDNPKSIRQVAMSSALNSSTGRPVFMPVAESELRFLGKLDDGKPVCPEGAKGRVGHLRRGLRRAPPDLLGQSRHVWDEAAYETVAWCGPALGSTVLR
ncbi:MAG TPA: hypothetical protein VM285_11285 [Polyangia bacterium]|nr:hypothetical protein [Polyangia bacterium]